MQETVEFLKNLYTICWGNYAYQGWFYLAILMILMLEKDKLIRSLYGGYALIILLIISNPITVKVVSVFFGKDSFTAYYCRLFSMLPLICTIAYAYMLLIVRLDGIRKMIGIFVVLIMIMLGGNNIYLQEWFEPAENLAKIPNEVVELCSYLHSDEKMIKIAVPSDLVCYIRQADAGLLMPYGRETKSWGALLDESPDYADEIIHNAAQEGCDYIVSKRTDDWWNAFAAIGLQPEYITDNYYLYRVMNVEGKRYAYNQQRQVISITYIDSTQKPMDSSMGYGRVDYNYDFQGRVIGEKYYDKDGKVYTTEQGYDGIQYIRDRQGRIVKWIFIDNYEQPILTTLGYAKIEYFYGSNERVEYVRYLDTEDNMCTNNYGYYGVEYEYDEMNLISRKRYVDMEKKDMMTTMGYASVEYEYDNAGKNIYESYYDEEGLPIASNEGYYAIIREYDDNNNEITQIYVDLEGKKVNNILGYASLKYIRDENGNVTEIKYYDKNGVEVQRDTQGRS